MKHRHMIAGLTLVGAGATAIEQVCNAGSAIAHFVHALFATSAP